MKEQIYADLKAMLPELQQALQTGVEYSGGLFRRFWAYIITVNAVGLLACVVGFILVYKLYKFWVEKYQKTEDAFDKGHVAFLGVVTISPALAVVLGLTIYITPQLLKSIFLPELVIVEYVQDLSHGSNSITIR
jgi:hypothetical protein